MQTSYTAKVRVHVVPDFPIAVRVDLFDHLVYSFLGLHTSQLRRWKISVLSNPQQKTVISVWRRSTLTDKPRTARGTDVLQELGTHSKCTTRVRRLGVSVYRRIECFRNLSDN